MAGVRSFLLMRRAILGAWVVAALVGVAVGMGRAAEADAAGLVTNCTSYGSAGTEGDLAWALAGGGAVNFACSGTIIVPEITIEADTTIDGTGQLVGLSGNGENRVFSVASGFQLDLIRLTITAGDASDANGAGVYAQDFSTVTLTNVTLAGNSAGLGGGGIYAGPGSNVVLANSTVVGNIAAAAGGGIYAGQSSTVTLTDTSVVGNAGVSGSGIYAGSFSVVTLTNSAVNGNAAVGFGGGIQASQATVGLTNSTVSTNLLGGSGGGISAAFSGITLTNSTVSGNVAGGAGGGVYTNRGTLTLTNSTVSGNTAGGAGGGILAGAADLVTLTYSTIAANGANTTGGGINVCANCAVSLTSTILAGNTASSGPNCSGAAPNSLGYNLIGDDSGCVFTPGTGDLVNVNPLLGPLQANGGPTQTHALAAGSPAIDAADPACPPPSTDQRGTPRPQGAGCDIGAYEVTVSEDTVTITWAIYARLFSVLFVAATSTASPDADLFLTVDGCLTEAPMQWSGRGAYVFFASVRSCGNLDGETATVTSSLGGVATKSIR